MRVVFIELARLSDAAFVSSAIAEAFGAADAVEADLPRRIRAACADRPTLAVLDNCEHVLDAAPLLATLVSAVHGLRLLATSRAPLRVRGEREYLVEPLAIEPDSSDAPPAAVRLLVDRIHDFDPNFRIADGGQLATAICRRLDALPLAIELAAPWFKALSADDILRRLEHNVLSATIGRRDLPARQQTMNATVAWSYRLLAQDEQRAFRRLGVLPGLFPIEAAVAVQAEGATRATSRERAQSTVAGLIERSLLQCVEGSCSTRPLYRMLETVRAYAATELAASGEFEAAMEGLIRYALQAASTADEQLVGAEAGVWLDHVRDDLESFRAAMRWLVERHRGSDACDVASHLLFFWLIRGHAAEGLRWYREFAELDVPPRTRAKALAGTAVMYYALGDIDRARRAGQRSLLVEAADPADVALAESMLGYAELASGNLPGAEVHFKRARSLYETLGFAWALSNVLGAIAWTALAAGDFDQADRVLDESAVHASKAGPWFSGIALYVRAVLAIRRGKPDEAIERVRDSLSRIRLLNDKFALVYALVPLSAAAELTGDDAWAARILGARDGVTERTGVMAVDESVRDLRERVERDSRSRLGPKRWAREYETGWNASLDSLLTEVDARCRKETNRSPEHLPNGR